MRGLARRRIAWLAVLAALATASLVIARASSAALTSPGASAWAHGALVLADEPASAGLFDVEGMLPGQAEVRCLAVRYDGDAPSAEVSLHATGVTGGLARFLDVLVETGGSCDAFAPEEVVFDGTLEGMAASPAAAGAAWHARRGERRAYRFSVTLRPDPEAQGLWAGADFVWDPGGARRGEHAAVTR